MHRILSRLAAGGVAMAITTAALPAQAAGACEVRFTSGFWMTYSEHNLKALVIEGQNTGPKPGKFRLIDDDGILSLSIILAQWQWSGITADNEKRATVVPSSDLLLALRAARIGIAYESKVIEVSQARAPSARPASHAEDIRKSKALRDDLVLLAVQLEPLIEGQGFDAVGETRIPMGFARKWLSEPLFRIGGLGTRRYIDSWGPKTAQDLCNPASSNFLLRIGLCMRDLKTEAWLRRDECPDGLRFERLSRALFCQTGRGTDGELKAHSCTSGIGGPPSAT